MAIVSLPSGVRSVEWTPPPRAAWASRSGYSNKATIIDRGGVTQGWRATVSFTPRNSAAELRLFAASLKGPVNNVQLAASEDQGGCPLATATVRGTGQVSNLIAQSQSVGASPWAPNGGSESFTANNVTAPDGTMTADTLNTPGAFDGYGQTAVAAAQPSTSYVASCWLKGTPGQTCAIFVNIGGATTAPVITLTGSWVRHSVTLTTGASPSSTLRMIIGRNGNTATTVQAWGAQLETGAAAGPYIPTVAAAVTSYESLIIGGLTSGVTYLNAGQLVTIKDRLHTLMTPIVGAADGSAIVTVDPPLPALTTTSDVVTLRAPYCLMRAAGTVPNWTAAPGVIYAPSDLELEEVIA